MDIAGLDRAGFVKMKNQLEMLYGINQEKRMEYKAQPEKYFESEGDLHAYIKEIQAVAAFPDSIGLFIDSGCPEVLLAILDHQNTDVCLECVTLLVELTDEDIAAQLPDAIFALQGLLVDNSVWNQLLRLMNESLAEIKGKKSQDAD